MCEEYRKRVTEIESSLNSNDYISHNLLTYFETVVINVVDSVCRLFHPNEPLPDSIRIVYAKVLLVAGFEEMCEVKKGLLEKYDNSIMANGILCRLHTQYVENISLTMTTASHKAYCSSRSEVDSPPLPHSQIENATLRIEKLLSAWSKHTLPLYPITFQLLCDTSSSLTSFVTVLCNAVATPIDAHSPFFNHAGWLDLHSHPPAVLPKDSLLLSLLSESGIASPLVQHNTSTLHSPVPANAPYRARSDAPQALPSPKRVHVEESDETPVTSPTSNEEEEDYYPHHSARRGSRYQTPVGEFDPHVRDTYKPTRTPPELVWDPTRLSSEQLNKFVAFFPADVLEDVYVVIQQKNYDLKLAYEEVGEDGQNEA